mgnify:CR=1 FL=1
MARTNKEESKAAVVRVRYGAYLKREREGRSFTQKYVADHLGFRTPQLISNWERGIAVPPLKEIRKLAKLYAVDRSELMDIVTEYQQAVCSDTLEHVRDIFNHRSKAQGPALGIAHLDS